MDSKEFSEWLVYTELEPFPSEQIVILLAQLCSLVANLFRSKGRAARPLDFMPWEKSTTGRRKTNEEMAAIFNRYAEMHNSTGKHGSNKHTRHPASSKNR